MSQGLTVQEEEVVNPFGKQYRWTINDQGRRELAILPKIEGYR